MSWRVVVYGLAGWLALAWFVCRFLNTNDESTARAEWCRLLEESRADLPIDGDDTWLRFERSKKWTNQEEGR